MKHVQRHFAVNNVGLKSLLANIYLLQMKTTNKQSSWRVAKGLCVTADEGKNKCLTREKQLKGIRDS